MLNNKQVGGVMKKTMTVVCAVLIAGRCLAQDLGRVPPDPRLTTTTEQAESVIAESEAEWKDKHPKMYAAGWTLVISVIGYALLAAIDKAGGDTNYNIGGDMNNANGNGGNGSSDSSSTTQSTGMGNNER